MKVLHALHFFLPRHAAGTEIYTAGVALTQAARHPVELFFTEKILTEENYALLQREHEGIPCHVLVNNLLYDGFRETFQQQRIEERFDEVLDRVRPDLLHLQHLLLLSLGLAERARRRGIPVVMTLHDFWLYCPRMGQLLAADGTRCTGPEPGKCATCLGDFKYRQGPFERRAARALRLVRRTTGLDLSAAVERLRRRRGGGPGRRRRPEPLDEAVLHERAAQVVSLIESVDLFLSPSRTVLDFMVRHGLPAAKVRHLPYGMAPLQATAPRTDRPQGRIRFGFVGTLVRHKGVHVLVEAFRQAHLENATLTVHGSARYDPGYARQLADLARGAAVSFAGEVPNRRVGEVLAGIDCLVVPSTWLENWPLAIQEARLAGVPVVASRLGGMAEAVRDGVDGLLFEPENPVDLAAKLAQVAADPDQLDRWAAAAPRPTLLAEHVELLEKLYDEVRAGRESR